MLLAQSRTTIQTAFLTGLLAIGWLLPNQYQPWRSFHKDAWISLTLAGLILGICLCKPVSWRVSKMPLILTFLALLPWLHHWSGSIVLIDDTAINSLYILGFALAVALGEHWVRDDNRRPVGVILGAAVVATIISAGIEIYQWMGFAYHKSFYDIWILGYIPGTGRPYANLGQPNLLASLLLWGVLGFAWLAQKNVIRVSIFVLGGAFLAIGLALTESRTALLTATAFTVCTAVWRPAFATKKFLWVMLSLYLFYVAALLLADPFARFLGLASESSIFDRSMSEQRPALWKMALHASTLKPWAGFGWNHTHEALLAVYPDHPQLAGGYFEQSHNLFLDLVLWVGWPLAILLFLGLGIWMFRLARTIRETEHAIVFAAILVMLIHSLFEYPLHYAFFLLPFGVLLGFANQTAKIDRLIEIPRMLVLAVALTATIFLCLIVRDYFEVEYSFTELRFEIQRIGQSHDTTPPNTLLLNDWSDYLTMVRSEPASGMSASEMSHWKALALYHASPLSFEKLVSMFIKNGQPQQARYWAERSCALMTAEVCKNLIRKSSSDISGF